MVTVLLCSNALAIASPPTSVIPLFDISTTLQEIQGTPHHFLTHSAFNPSVPSNLGEIEVLSIRMWKNKRSDVIFFQSNLQKRTVRKMYPNYSIKQSFIEDLIEKRFFYHLNHLTLFLCYQSKLKKNSLLKIKQSPLTGV